MWLVGKQPAHVREEERERGQALLAVHYEALISFVRDDDRAKEVIAVLRNIRQLMMWLIVVEEG